MMELLIDAATLSLIEAARREDLGDADVTTALLERPDRPARMDVVAKRPGVFAGRSVAEAVVRIYDPQIRIEWTPQGVDGAVLQTPPARLGTLRGRLDSLLAAERVMLNFLQRLCGIATLTRQFVDAVAGTQAAIYDTRKTTPGWRLLEKHAVRCGGGRSHRTGLYDAVLLKDNHLAGIPTDRLAAEVFHMLNRLGRLADPPVFVAVEAQSLQQLRELFKIVGIHMVLLDNFAVPDMAAAVQLRDGLGLKGRVELEVSGGVSLQTVRAIAETGVERISVGALTHSAPALDLSLERVE